MGVILQVDLSLGLCMKQVLCITMVTPTFTSGCKSCNRDYKQSNSKNSKGDLL
jgi:hypothetical protein